MMGSKKLMTLKQVIELISPVKRSGRGWMAKCPAHQDRRASLSIREAEDRLLLHCFAGCAVEEVCQALGIKVRDLFVTGLSSMEWEYLQKRRREQQLADHKREMQQGALIDVRREAETLLRAYHGQDTSQWSDKQFDRVMNAVGQALAFLREENEEYFYEYIGRKN